jgi:hypothetical protein
LQSILWFEVCSLSCGLKFARYPVVWRFRSILLFEDCALSCDLKITRYLVVWKLRPILWCAESGLWNVHKKERTILCVTCRIQLISILLPLQPNNSHHAAR